MNSLTASLELWLKLQCQMLPKVVQAFLASTDSNNHHQFLAQWPAADMPSDTILEAVNQVAQKQRIHLVKLDDSMLLGQPVILNGKYFGAVVLHIASNDTRNTKQAVETLSRGLVWLQFLLYEQSKNHPQIASSEAISNPSPSPLIEKLLKENSPQETAISLVNLLATQLQCSRVSLGWQTAQGIALDAVSFSANFDKRTHAMQLLLEVMNEACDQGANIHCVAHEETAEPAEPQSAPPEFATQIKRSHHQLLVEQSLQSVSSFLLRKDKLVIGVIVMESSQAPDFNAEQQQFIQGQLPLITHIMDLKKTANAGLWQRLKHLLLLQATRWLGEQRSLLKVIGIALAAFLAVLFIPTDYHISSDASLKSAYKHLLVSPQDGYLKHIKVRPGDLVKKGDLLAQLNDDELSLQRRKLASQAQQYRQEYDTALANSNRVAAAIASTQVDQASIQLRLVEQQLERIQLLAPSDGMVVSDDISQSLGAPVKQGDMLFEIAAVEGYLVQLMVDERDIAALQVGQSGHVKLTSLPNDVFEFRVKTITPISEILNGRNYFRVEASLQSETPILRPGMTGTGKITAGKRTLGWIWFHDLWHWLSLKLWW